ncbi:MAG: sulfatase [Gemmatimonadetes bacterium]|nr:sulfatase [Gemmatimonadota bacterium]
MELRWRRDGSAAPPALLLDFAVAWCVGGVLRRTLFAAIAGSLWPFPPMPWFERLGLIAFGFIGGVPGVVLIAIGMRLLMARPRLTPILAAAVRWCGFALAYSVELFIFLSWGTYYSTREFLNADLLALFVRSPTQVFDHVAQIAPVALVVVPVVAGAVLALTWYLRRWVDTWPARRTRALVLSVGATIALSMVVAMVAEPARSRSEDAEASHDLFLSVAAAQSGPTARILADLLHVVSNAEDRLSSWPASVTTPRPVIDAAAWARGIDAAKAHRWNVIVVMVESMRADVLTVLGGRRVVMPTVEAIARDGVVYADAVTPASHSDYATTSVLSSQYPLRTPTFAPFPARPPYPRVLPWDLLRPLGYRTAVFSSQNEHWQGMYDFLNTGNVEHFLHAETYQGDTYVDSLDFGFFKWLKENRHAGKIDDSDTIDEAIAWTDSIAPGAPFVAYVNLQSSHTPYRQPLDVPPRFGSGRVSFRIVFGKYPADSAGAVRDLYDNTLAYADAQLGRLVDALKQSGRWDSTVMVVLGDHGEGFYEHGFGAHGGSLYHEVTHVPVVIHAPGLAPRVDSLPAASIDVLPTVLGLLGLPAHPGFQGIDLGDSTARRHRPQYTLAETGLATEVAVEQDGWKLRFNLFHSDMQLFDVRHDPFETRDVSAEHPVQQHALLSTIGVWWATQMRYYKGMPANAAYYAPVLRARAAVVPP